MLVEIVSVRVTATTFEALQLEDLWFDPDKEVEPRTITFCFNSTEYGGAPYAYLMKLVKANPKARNKRTFTEMVSALVGEILNISQVYAVSA